MTDQATLEILAVAMYESHNRACKDAGVLGRTGEPNFQAAWHMLEPGERNFMRDKAREMLKEGIPN